MTQLFKKSVYILLAVILLTLTFVPPRQSAEAQLDPITIGGLIVVGKLAKDFLNDTIDNAGEEARQTLEKARDELQAIIDELESTYGDILDVTIDQLDEFTRRTILETQVVIEDLIQSIELGVEQTIEQLDGGLQARLEQARVAINDAAARAEDVVALVVAGSVLLVDKAAFNLSFIIAVILLGLGIITFVRLLFRHGLPKARASRVLSLVGMSLFLLLFGSLLVPQPRAYALTYSRFGSRLDNLTQPRIFSVMPATLVIGKTKHLVLSGARLAPEGRQPEVTITGIELAPGQVNGGDDLISVDLTGLDLSGQSEVLTINLRTTDGQEATIGLPSREPFPLPQLESWRITPTGRIVDNAVGQGHVTCQTEEGRFQIPPSCEFSEEIQLPDGAKLDLGFGEGLDDSSSEGFLNAGGDANRGFGEFIEVFRGFGLTRNINYIRRLGEPIGIKVTGGLVAKCSSGLLGLQCERSEVDIRYLIQGPHTVERRGQTWEEADQPCSISGIGVCGRYPHTLPQFIDGGPEKYDVQVIFTSADGESRPSSGVVFPDNPAFSIAENLRVEDDLGRLRLERIELRIDETGVLRFLGPELGTSSPSLDPETVVEINNTLMELRLNASSQ